MCCFWVHVQGPQVARPAPQPVDLHSAWFAKHIEGRTIGNANSLPCLTAAVAGSLGAMQPLGAGQVAGAASASPAPAGATGAAGADVQAADKLPAAAAGIPVAAAANAEQGVMGTAQAAADDKQQQPQPASADVEGKASAAETDAPPGADASKHAADNAGTAAAAPASSGAPSADAAAAKPAASASVVRWWQDVNATFGKLGMVDPAVIGSQMPLPNGAAGMGGQVPLSAGAAVLQFHQMSLMPPGPGGMGMGVAQGGIMVPGVGVIGHGPGGLHILTDQELMPAPHGLPRCVFCFRQALHIACCMLLVMRHVTCVCTLQPCCQLSAAITGLDS